MRLQYETIRSAAPGSAAFTVNKSLGVTGAAVEAAMSVLDAGTLAPRVSEGATDVDSVRDGLFALAAFSEVAGAVVPGVGRASAGVVTARSTTGSASDPVTVAVSPGSSDAKSSDSAAMFGADRLCDLRVEALARC